MRCGYLMTFLICLIGIFIRYEYKGNGVSCFAATLSQKSHILKKNQLYLYPANPHQGGLNCTLSTMNDLIRQVKKCTHCAAHLPHGCRPIFTVHPNAKILIIGQAPGRKVHESGIPWDDASGRRLRDWLGVDDPTFYNPQIFSLVPMGFCYPGTGKSGDLSPRPECAPKWHAPLINMMPEIKLTLLFGQYAQGRYLGNKMKRNLTETVRHWQAYAPIYLPLPHPSPRNQIWERKNPWFGEEVLPYLKKVVAAVIS